jgi:hypothetical protein
MADHGRVRARRLGRLRARTLRRRRAIQRLRYFNSLIDNAR